jgi:purine-binding chemotaxis protein CheW
MTYVPQAPEYVKGIVNLRGNIVTIIDLGKKLGLSATKVSDECRNIIVDSNDEYIGLLVEKVKDVIRTNSDDIESPPKNIVGVHGKYFDGVFKTDNSLIGVLNVEEVLKIE